MDNVLTEKTCGKCKLTLPISCFQRNSHGKDGYRPRCVVCTIGHVSKNSKTLEERFWENVKITDECWEWIGTKRKHPVVGLLTFKKVQLKAQRVSWNIHFGVLPASEAIAQTCRNPLCVKPEHLLLARNLAPEFQDRLWGLLKNVNGCWEWTGTKTKSGYGRISVKNRSTSTHRLAWIDTFGAIPKGMFVCHRCDNPSCCNPEHLFLGTCQDNVADRESKHRTAIGERVSLSKLTADNVKAIREMRSSGLTHKQIGAMFGVKASAVFSILHRLTWKHI